MKELGELLAEAGVLVNELVGKVDEGTYGLKQVEERIVWYVNRIGSLLVDEVVHGVGEPVTENRVWVDGTKALYKGMTNLSFITRFGGKVSRSRRGYRIEGDEGRWYPLDEKLGLHVCSGYSPLMTYLLTLFGSAEAFVQASRHLSAAVGVKISGTAVQRNTENVGRGLEDRPLRSIGVARQNSHCDLMVVEIDGTTSPQIMETEGISGRESLKAPTEYKECNVVVIEKQQKYTIDAQDRKYRRKDRWTGAVYGPRVAFGQYVHEAGIAMGQLQAAEVVFLADGAKHNWEIQMDNFPEATTILDVYHALEHLAAYCGLFVNQSRGKQRYGRWRELMLEGDTLQLLHEMRCNRQHLGDRSEGQKHINYFQTNAERMAYDTYQAMGYPIGSGLVEGSCKLVVGKRFKANGMRWKREDNKAVLKTRLAVLNQELEQMFTNRARKVTLSQPKSPIAA